MRHKMVAATVLSLLVGAMTTWSAGCDLVCSLADLRLTVASHTLNQSHPGCALHVDRSPSGDLHHTFSADDRLDSAASNAGPMAGMEMGDKAGVSLPPAIRSGANSVVAISTDATAAGLTPFRSIPVGSVFAAGSCAHNVCALTILSVPAKRSAARSPLAPAAVVAAVRMPHFASLVFVAQPNETPPQSLFDPVCTVLRI